MPLCPQGLAHKTWRLTNVCWKKEQRSRMAQKREVTGVSDGFIK